MTTPSAATTYHGAPDLHEEQEDLLRTRSTLSRREWLLRRAALADRQTLTLSTEDGKAQQHVHSAVQNLARYDQEHGTAAGPAPTDASLESLRAYIRREYTAWRTST